MTKTKSVVRYLLALSIISALGFASYFMYLKWPTGVDYELAKPLEETLGDLLELAKEDKRVSGNPLTSSTYRKGDILYRPIIAIQQGRWGEAKKMLTPLVEEGNADAMFWLADITYRSSAFSGSEGAALFQKAAEMGNPYAAIKLSPKYNTRQCKMRMPSYCEEKWGDIALEILLKRSKKGDIKANYAYLYYTRFEQTDKDYFESLLSVVKKGIKTNYYAPLQYLVYMYQTRKDLNPFVNDVNPLSNKDANKLVDLLMIAARNNDVVSIEIINNVFKESLEPLEYLEPFQQAVKRTLPAVDFRNYSATFDYFVYTSRKNGGSFPVMGYAYASLFDFQAGQNEGDMYRRIYESSLKISGINTLTESNKLKAKEIASMLSGDNTPATIIDEVRGAWVLYEGTL